MKNQSKLTSIKDLLITSISPAKPGQLLEGTIIEKTKSNIFVDLGPLGMGIILGKEMKENPSILKELEIGQTVNCFVLEPENEKGYVEVSLKEASKELSWEKLQKLRDNGETFPAKVLQANRGGLVVEVLDQKAFLPVSQLSPENYPRVEGGAKEKILQELNKFVGKELSVKIIDVDPREDKIIASEKALNKEEVQTVMDTFPLEGAFEGTVMAVTDFGAFVRLENADKKAGVVALEGLVHISEMDWGLVNNPRDIVRAGDTIKVKIIGYHQGRPSLSIKALKERPSA